MDEGPQKEAMGLQKGLTSVRVRHHGPTRRNSLCEYERQKQAKTSKNKQKHMNNECVRNLNTYQLLRYSNNDAIIGKCS